MIRIIIIGAGGQMGEEIIKAADTMEDIQVIGGVERKDHPLFGRQSSGIRIDKIKKFANRFDCAVDFSHPEATIKNLEYLVMEKKPVVLGTTGFDDQQLSVIDDAAQRIPILMAPNMAYGINVLLRWMNKLVGSLKGFDIELVEAHHKRKKDAPSGTALRIIKELKKVRPDAKEVYGRHGPTGPRQDGEIGVAAIRGGDVFGVHNLYLLGPGEEIIISHRALSRKAFAIGALRAVQFVVNAQPGLYSMEDLINETSRS